MTKKLVTHKHCKNSSCPEINPQSVSNFNIAKNVADGRRGKCITCTVNDDRIWSKRNPDKRKGYSIKLYWPGLTANEAYNEYIKLLEKQNHTCAICKQPEKIKHNNGVTRNLAVDHCHDTGKVRGLLCAACNYAVGLFKNSPIIALNFVKYLEGSNG